MKRQRIVLFFLIICSVACSRGNKLSGLEGDAGNAQTPVEKMKQIMDIPVSSQECGTVYPVSADWSQELMVAIRSGDAGCVQYVIEQGRIDVNQAVASEAEQRYPLWQALTTSALFFARGDDDRQTIRVLKVLVDAGAHLETKNSQGQTALQFALEDDEVFTRYPQVALYLILSEKINLNEANAQGFTPLHWAVLRKSALHLQALVDKGANLEAHASGGKTALQLAEETQFDEGIGLLKAKRPTL